MVKSRKKGISVDFTDVESGGRKVPDGDYEAEIVKIEEKESSAGNDMLVFTWKILSGAGKGGRVYDNVSLLPQALWRFKTLLEVLGEEVPDGAMEIDPEDLIGKTCRLEITNEKYEGQDRPKVTNFGASEGAEAEEEAEEEPEEEEEAEDDDKETSKPNPKGKPDERVGKAKPKAAKFKLGQRVKFTDEDEKVHKGEVTKIEDDVVTVEDSRGDEYEVESTELTAL